MDVRDFDSGVADGPAHALSSAMEVWHLADGYRLEAAGAVFRCSGKSAELAFSQQFWARPVLEQRDFLQNSVLMLMQASGRHGIHASGVGRGRTCALFVADSGGGKTTSALSLMSAGWRHLGDDAVVLSMPGDTVQAHALRRGYSWTGKTRAAFPSLHPDDGLWRSVADGKWLAVPGGRARGQRARVCVPDILLFPEVGRARHTRLEPVGPSQALVRLIEQSSGVLAGRESAKGQLEMLAGLVRQARSFRFIAGRDVLDDPASVSSLLVQSAGANG